MELPDVIATERLRLRPPHPEDAPRIHAYTADPEVSRHLTWRPHRTMEDTHAYLAASIERR
ncbi:MAG: GNAT family N-acetyltransferase, partial [Alphaproteobacteria bacterium]